MDLLEEIFVIFYNDEPIGFESLVELPRTGECYRRAGWQKVGITKGYTCKRIGGKSTDSWTGRRIWNKNELRPKLVYCYKISKYKRPIIRFQR